MTLLAQLLIAERHRPRAGAVGHSVPLALELDVAGRSLEPLLISTTRGTFLESRVSRAGYARFGFSECPLSAEPVLVREFYRVLVACGKANEWRCMAATVEEAIQLMLGRGVRPGHLVVGPEWSSTSIELPVLDGGFSPGSALLVAEPTEAGLYVRVGEHVGILAYRVDRNFVAVTL